MAEVSSRVQRSSRKTVENCSSKKMGVWPQMVVLALCKDLSLLTCLFFYVNWSIPKFLLVNRKLYLLNLDLKKSKNGRTV